MNYAFFGDSYDIVKQSVMRWLADYGPWAVHPMFTDEDPGHYAKDYCRLLDVSAVSKMSIKGVRRPNWLAACDRWQDSLFLDPDKGLVVDKPGGLNNKLLTVCELVTIAKARPQKLTLVFDQSINHDVDVAGTNEEQTNEKLLQLKSCGVYGFAYRSHANFVVASSDEDLLRCAKNTLLSSSLLPAERIVEF